jgi:predicted site-specific integrase-resolvase|tara:strand:+ start:3818 stop:4198 length:381 start_codon:yes stop_codon:yes gene_type:complete
MASYTITEASRKTGKTRQTIHRYIKKGKLSATVDDDGIKHIDEAELGRVFGLDGVAVTDTDTVTKVQVRSDSQNVELLEYKVEMLTKQLEEEKARSNKLLDIVENTTLALPKPETSKKGFFKRLFD